MATPFATAIEEFILDKKSKEDKNSLFYKQLLSKVSTGKVRRDVPEESRRWAQQLSSYVDELQEVNRKKSHGRRVVDRLGPVVSGLNQYAGACDVLIQAAPDAAMLLYGGARLLLQLIQKVNDCYNTVVGILEDIGLYIQCFHSFSKSYETSELVRKQLIKSYKAIIHFWLDASRLLSNRTFKSLFSRNSQLSDKWQDQRTALVECRAEVSFAIQAAEAELQRRRDLQNDAQLSELKRKENMQHVVRWIKACVADEKLDCRSLVRDKAALRHKDTGSWLLAHPSYSLWQEAKTNMSLRLCAPPGTGKSVLTSFLTQHLERQVLHDKKLRTVTYFFSYNDPDRRKPITALRSIAIQLLAMYDFVPDAVLRLWSKDALNPIATLDQDTAVQVVQALTKQISRVHILIDGIDECQERPLLLNILKQIMIPSNYGIVKWFLTSRSEMELEIWMNLNVEHHINAPIDCLLGDIRTFAAQKLRHELCFDCEHCIDGWISNSQGNFLWADLTLRIMDGEGVTCEGQIQEALDAFPPGLQCCYERSLLYLVGRNKDRYESELAQRVFSLIIGAVQPLRLSEVEHALIALHSFTRSSRLSDYDEKWRPNPGLIETLCSGLVVFERPEGCANTDPLLKFNHKSVHDFFVQDTSLRVPDVISKFFTTEEDATLLLGEACLGYLSFARYGSPQSVTSMLANPQHAFLSHAASFWHHYLGLTVLPEPRLVERVIRFMRSPCFWNCVEVQVHTVPHQFALYYKSRGSHFRLQPSASESYEDPKKVNFASPVPSWLDDRNYGQGGQDIVEGFSTFIKSWHPVMNSYPSALNQCVMDRGWESSFLSKRNWNDTRVTATQLSNRRITTAQFAAIVNVTYSSKTPDIILLTRLETNDLNRTPKITSQEWTLGDTLRLLAESIDHRNLEPPSEEFALLSTSEALPVKSSRPPVSPHAQNLVAETYCISSLMPGHLASATPSSSKHLIPTEHHNKSWFLFGHSKTFHLHPDPTSTVLTAVCGTDSLGQTARSHSGSDSGLDFEGESDSGSERQSIADFSDDSELDPEISSNQGSDRCMIIVVPGKVPHYSFWSSTSTLDETICAISSKRGLAIWSSGTSEICIVRLAADPMRPVTVYLPEPANMTSSSSVAATRKEFHFSEHGNIVYYLLYTADATDAGVKQRLSITQLVLTMSDSGPHVDRHGTERTIQYCSFGAPRSPSILTAWTSDSLYAALPQLNCDPKLVRLRLAEQHSFETIYKPIYFPASTLSRNPKLYAFENGNNDMQTLVLTLDSEPTTDGKVIVEPPLVMKWSLTDWQDWDEGADAESELYRNAHDVCGRLRGTFVDANQRFNVAIRSGLDWRKKAFVSCA